MGVDDCEEQRINDPLNLNHDVRILKMLLKTANIIQASKL